MGCKWLKSLDKRKFINSVFENGRVHKQGNDYFFKVNRHQDKLPPKIVELFESNMNKGMYYNK